MDEKEQIKEKVEEIYTNIKDRLTGQEGKIVAIDWISGDYFVGDDTMEAYEQGRKKHPTHKFFFKRVGARAAYFVGALAK